MLAPLRGPKVCYRNDGFNMIQLEFPEHIDMEHVDKEWANGETM